MRHTQSKLINKSSDVLTNLKVSNTPSKCAGGSKRVTTELREQCAKKCRKSGVTESGNRKATASATVKANADAEKTLRKYNPSVVRKATLNLKRIKKPNEKYKQIGSRVNRNQRTHKKIQKKVTKSFERNDEHEGPPTLCETFSRITTMVAETVINEKENQKLAESLLGKAKKETAPAEKPRRETANSDAGPGKSKGEPSTAETSTSKVKRESQGCVEFSQAAKSKKELPKTSVEKRAKSVPSKAKDKAEKSKSSVKKGSAVKSAAVKTLNEKQSAEPAVKAVKDDEVSVSGRGIVTRRVSAPGSPESEKETESKIGSEKHKIISPAGTNGPVKSLNVTKALEKGRNDKKTALNAKTAAKRKDNNRTKSESKEKKPKINDSQLPVKKLADEMSLGKDKEEDAQQGCSYKKVNKKSKLSKKSKHLLKTNSETAKGHKKDNKVEGTTTKSARPKLGSETDGSNSDELTLNMIQRKAKKCDKNDSNSPKIKSEPSSPQDESKAKADEKTDSSDKNSNDKSLKNKKIKAEKDDDDLPLEKKLLDEILKKRRGKETESDTDEDLEFRRLLAKKLAKNVESGSLPQVKRKRVEPGPSDSDQRARRLRLFGFWSGPKRHRVASLNALAKVHCLYENESKGVMAEIEKMGQILKSDTKKEKKSSRRSGKSVVKKDTEELESEKLDTVVINKRRLRGTPGTRGAGKHWDMFPAEFTTSTSCPSSDESHSDTDMSKGRPLPLPPSYRQKMQKKEEIDKEETAKAPKRRRKTEIGVTMDLKDMVVRKRMASLNASAILAASYSSEKRSNRKGSSGTSTEDGLSSPDEGRGDFLSADESDNSPVKKSGEKSLAIPDAEKAKESQSNEKDDNKRRKNFWKTKVENLKKASKEKRNSPSPILADFAVGKDLSTTVLEKEKKDELNDDKERDKGNGSCKIKCKRKRADMKSKRKTDASNNKSGKGKESRKRSSKGGKEGSSHTRKKLTKRKLKDDELKNANVDNANSSEKNDEYEYKSDSDNGQRKLIELRNTGGSNKKVAVIVNQDTDVTITGVYVNSTRSTHHEGYCSIAGMQYRISSTSHTQTEATAVLKTSIASEQTPPPTEPTNCTSPRNHKSYTPLSALSNMQPPAGAPPHTHLPPPLPPPHHHHHHHHCGMGQHRPPHDKYLGHGPPHDQYLSHGPPQGPISPLGRRHGCSSAFSAPHCTSQPHTGRNSPTTREDDGFGPPMPSHGYFQPAGPLIHNQPANTTTTSTTTKSHIASIEANPASESQVTSTATEEIVETSRIGENPPPPNPTHHIGYPRGYPPYQGYYQGGYYPPPQTSHYQTPPPPAFHHYHHHHQDLCYPPAYPTTTYPPPPASYRRFLQPAPGYFTSEVSYTSTAPQTSQDAGAQQMVVPGGPSSSYSAPLDPYPPPAPYYAGYTGPSAACYSHPPSSRSLAFIEQTYQSCPCPVQSCPKNVHIGPLTGECKRPGALPLPPVALQLPQEPPGTAGPPSPARGSAGVAPLLSPMSNARHSHGQPLDGRHARPSAAESRQARPAAGDFRQAIPALGDFRQALPALGDFRQVIPAAADLRQAIDLRQARPAATETSSHSKRNAGRGRSEAKKKSKTEVLYTPRSRLWNPAEIMRPNTSRSMFTVQKSEVYGRAVESTSTGVKGDAFPHVFSHMPGLLAIGSPGFPQIPLWPQNQEREEICVVDEVEESDSEEQKVWIEECEAETDQNERKRKAFSDDLVKGRKRRKNDDENRDRDNQEKIVEIVENFEENVKKVEECADIEIAEEQILETEENKVKVELVAGKTEKKQGEVNENGEKAGGVEETGQIKEEKEQRRQEKEPTRKDDKEQRKDEREQKREDKQQKKDDKEQRKEDKEQAKEQKGQVNEEKGETNDDKGQKDKQENLEDKGETAKENEKEKELNEGGGEEEEGEREREREGEGEGEGEAGEEGKVEEQGMKGIEGEMASDDLLKRGKRKVETPDESPDNKERKSKKKFIVNQKDEDEIAAGSVQKSSHKSMLNPKAKPAKETHDTVSEVIEEVVKGRTYLKSESEKISGRRKSSQEKSSAPVAESSCTRKSRSCSPNRPPKEEESRSPGRAAREEAKRRLSEYGSSRGSRAYGKCKLELRSKSSEKGSQEHSKTSKSSKRGSKAKSSGKVSQGGSSSGVKSKKSSSALVPNPKKVVPVPNEIPLCPKPVSSPKWSNGWSWDSEPFYAKVYLTNDEGPVMRKCYSAMRHVEGDVIRPKDCVLLKSSPRKTDSPFIAKVCALWENPEDGEMMVSLLWYYRPEHTDQVRDMCDGADEIFASRHKDTNSVACIEDKCFVLTYNEYCRYRKRVRQLEEGVPDKAPVVPAWETPSPRLRRQPPCAMAPDLVFYCRRVYDFRQKRLLKNPS